MTGSVESVAALRERIGVAIDIVRGLYHEGDETEQINGAGITLGDLRRIHALLAPSDDISEPLMSALQDAEYALRKQITPDEVTREGVAKAYNAVCEALSMLDGVVNRAPIPAGQTGP